MAIWDEGRLSFLVCVSHIFIVFTFSGGWIPVEDAGRCSNVSSSPRPFPVTLDSLQDRCASFHPDSGPCAQPRPRRLRRGLRERFGQQRAREDHAPGRGAGSERPARPGSLQLGHRGRPLPGGPDTPASKASPRFYLLYAPGAAPRGAGLWPRSLVRSPLPPRGLRPFQEGVERGRGQFNQKGGDSPDLRKEPPPPSTPSRAQVSDRPRKMETRRPRQRCLRTSGPWTPHPCHVLDIGVIRSSIMGLYPRLLIHDTADKPLGRSQIFAIRSKGSVNILLFLLSLGPGNSSQF